MPKLLIVCRQQFGYLVDIYKWCEYLPADYQIDIVTFAVKEKITLDKPNVKVHYVSYRGNKILRGIRFVLVALWYMCFFKGKIIVEYFSGCSVLKNLLPRKKMILDVRTLSVKNDANARDKENSEIKKSCYTYDFVTIISEGTRDAILLDKNKSAIVPLGADVVSLTDKTFEDIRLLYIGTLSGRDIEKTLKGVAIFKKQRPNVIIHYDIIGDGYNNELQKLNDITKDLKITDCVTLHGFKPHTEIKEFLDKCNVGVAFIPITEYYNHQPPTKTYEYILSGLFTIATKTFCNSNIINHNNGILIKDTEVEFASAINYIYQNRKQFKSAIVRETLLEFTWENVVRKELLPCLDSLRHE